MSAIPFVLAGMLAVFAAIAREARLGSEWEAYWEAIERVGWIAVAILAL